VITSTTVNWLAGGGQGEFPDFYDGDRIIVAVAVCDQSEKPQGKWHWEYHIIVAVVDSETPLHWNNSDGDGWCSWGWTDVIWWTPAKFDLPLEGSGP
jgi:hypothetical protein